MFIDGPIVKRRGLPNETYAQMVWIQTRKLLLKTKQIL